MESMGRGGEREGADGGGEGEEHVCECGGSLDQGAQDGIGGLGSADCCLCFCYSRSKQVRVNNGGSGAKIAQGKFQLHYQL